MCLLVCVCEPLSSAQIGVCMSLCVCTRQWYLVWPVGPRRLQDGDSAGLCCASANLLNCKARGGGVKERPHPLWEVNPAI